ncbi:MAG: hypothetical protein V3T11_10035 [Roseateles sp.]
MEQQQTETEAEAPVVVEDTSHFKQLRRGFGNGRLADLYVGKLLDFTPDDFTWELTDVYESDRSVSCALRGKPTADTQAHIEMLVGLCGEHSLPLVDRGLRGELRDQPWAHKTFKVEWHYKGCRSVAHKRKRVKDARSAIDAECKTALSPTAPGAMLDACLHFNVRMRGIIECLNERYVNTWIQVLTEGDRKWALDERKARELDAVMEQVADLHITMTEMRRDVRKLRDKHHALLTEQVRAKLDAEGWTDNNDSDLPDEVCEAVKLRLHAPRKDKDMIIG